MASNPCARGICGRVLRAHGIERDEPARARGLDRAALHGRGGMRGTGEHGGRCGRCHCRRFSPAGVGSRRRRLPRSRSRGVRRPHGRLHGWDRSGCEHSRLPRLLRRHRDLQHREPPVPVSAGQLLVPGRDRVQRDPVVSGDGDRVRSRGRRLRRAAPMRDVPRGTDVLARALRRRRHGRWRRCLRPEKLWDFGMQRSHRRWVRPSTDLRKRLRLVLRRRRSRLSTRRATWRCELRVGRAGVRVPDARLLVRLRQHAAGRGHVHLHGRSLGEPLVYEVRQCDPGNGTSARTVAPSRRHAVP